MKESAWAKSEGHEVGFDTENPDLILVSVIFQKNRAQALGIREMFPGVEIRFGGPGMYPECGNIGDAELIMPDYDLYPSEYSQGFTTRGCIRACPFCLVPKMEGNIQVWQHPEKFHDERFDTCMIMDNNLLAVGKWAGTVLKWFHDQGVKMLSHGWDARLLTDETAGLLKDVRHKKGIQLAWDNMGDEVAVFRALKLLKGAGFNLRQDISFYVLAGFNTSFDQDLYRCNKLREAGTNAFVMCYHKKDRRLNRLAKWANRRWAYWSSPFVEARGRGQ